MSKHSSFFSLDTNATSFPCHKSDFIGDSGGTGQEGCFARYLLAFLKFISCKWPVVLEDNP